MCVQGSSYEGRPNQICGGEGTWPPNWGETQLEVWRLANPPPPSGPKPKPPPSPAPPPPPPAPPNTPCATALTTACNSTRSACGDTWPCQSCQACIIGAEAALGKASCTTEAEISYCAAPPVDFTAFQQSRLITAAQGAQLNSWANLSFSTRWTLCYTSFGMAQTPAAFHTGCDKYKTTFTVGRIKAGNVYSPPSAWTFGGYADASFSYPGNYRISKGGKGCFIFGLGPDSPQRIMAGMDDHQNGYDPISTGPDQWPRWDWGAPGYSQTATLDFGDWITCSQPKPKCREFGDAATCAGQAQPLCGAMGTGAGGSTNFGETDLEV